MKKYVVKSIALILGIGLTFSGCGSSSDGEAEEQQASYPELESAKKLLTFYGATSNDHYAFDVETNTLTNLNDNNKTAMLSGEEGRLFVFRDDKGDNNNSTFEDKVVMFKADYSFTDHNATWEDFYYLNHLSNGAMHPHDSVEFNSTDETSGKYKAMVRLNTYIQAQESLKNELSTLVAQKSTSLCDFASIKHEDETHYFVMGVNGYVYTYDNNGTDTEFKDATLVSSAGCEVGQSGMSAAEDGVLIYLKSTTKLYLVDSHEDGVSHVHSSWNLSELLPAGKNIDMMVGIVDLEADGHEH